MELSAIWSAAIASLVYLLQEKWQTQSLRPLPPMIARTAPDRTVYRVPLMPAIPDVCHARQFRLCRLLESHRLPEWLRDGGQWLGLYGPSLRFPVPFG